MSLGSGDDRLVHFLPCFPSINRKLALGKVISICTICTCKIFIHSILFLEDYIDTSESNAFAGDKFNCTKWQKLHWSNFKTFRLPIKFGLIDKNRL